MASVSKREWTHKGVKKEAWIVRFKDRTGTHKQRTFTRKKEADQFKVRIESERANGEVYGSGRDTKLKAVCDSFLKFQEERVRDGRIGRGRYEQMKMAIDNHILPHLGTDADMATLSVADVEDFYSTLRREGKKKQGGNLRKDGQAIDTGGLAPVTAKERVSILGLIERYAQRRKLVKGGVVPEAMASFRGIKKAVIRTFTTDEVRSLFAALEKRPMHKQHRAFDLLVCMVHVAAFCGLRYGEIIGLTHQNIDLAGRIIQVRHSLTIRDELKGPKTRAGVRDVPMPPHVARIIKEWISRHYIENDRGLVFTSATGTLMHSSNFHNNLWQPLLERAGLYVDGQERLHFHALRHFAASWMIENGLPLTDVATLLGHSTFDMTLQVYAHPVIAGNRRHAVMDKMADSLLIGNQITIDAAALTPSVSQELRIDA